MKRMVFLLCILLIDYTYAFSTENEIWLENSESTKIIYADLNGDSIKEKITIKKAVEQRKTITYLSIFKNETIVFKYTFDKLPVYYIKIVNFKGMTTTSNRDVLFLMVGECGGWVHSVSFEKQTNMDGSKSSSRYVVKEFAFQVQSCY